MWVRQPNDTIIAVDNSLFLPDPRLQVQYDRERGIYTLVINVSPCTFSMGRRGHRLDCVTSSREAHGSM